MKSQVCAFGLRLYIRRFCHKLVRHFQVAMVVCSCWLGRTAFYYAFALPVGVVILVNSVLFGLIIKGITCDRTTGLQSTQARGELTMLQLQAGIASFVILGGRPVPHSCKPFRVSGGFPMLHAKFSISFTAHICVTE